jgi:chromosome segregation ATPase
MTTTTEALETATATANEWRSACGKIETQAQTLKATIAELERKRRDNALDAALGKPAARTAISGAYEEQATAEKQVADLEFALTEARARLQSASFAEGAARRACNLEAARVVIDRRITVAASIDAHLAQLESAKNEYKELFHEIMGFNELFAGVSVSTMESREGLGRLKALNDGGSGSLESSERMIWRGLA